MLVAMFHILRIKQYHVEVRAHDLLQSILIFTRNNVIV